jgi:hypothetical protein
MLLLRGRGENVSEGKSRARLGELWRGTAWWGPRDATRTLSLVSGGHVGADPCPRSGQRGRTGASARRQAGPLRPWAGSGGSGPLRKEIHFYFYFSIKTTQKCYFEQVKSIFKA